MPIKNVDDVIKHYLRYLDEHKYRYFPSLPVQTAVADRDYTRPPEHLPWEDAPLPYPYGREWTTWWFRMTARMPAEAEGQPVFLHVVPNIDSLVFVNGAPAGAANFYHKKVRLTEAAQPDETFEIHVESYAGHKMPSGGDDDFVSFLNQGRERLLVHYASGVGHGCWRDGYPLTFAEARLATRNEPLYALYYDAFVLYNLACHLDDNSLRKSRILSGLYTALMKLHFAAGPDTQRAQALAVCADLKPLLACRNGDTAPTIYYAGHAHLDTVWLWPFAESKRKMARTFSNMARLADEFPDFVFLQPQACHLDQMARDYPEIFARIEQAYRRGQWDPNGGSWVEMDTNLPGGESLIRQFVIGSQTTRHWLGCQGDTFWSPDTFGHSAALPQILRGCEVRFFVAGRVGAPGSDFPYDIFRWHGLDGTAVDAQLLRGGYGSYIMPQTLLATWNNMQQKDVSGCLIGCAGYGDGGGGTSRSDLEVMTRSGNLEGCPKTRWCKISTGLKTVFACAENIPNWRGEIEIPYFQGTFTTNAQLKKLNRRLEHRLREVEFLSALTMPGAWDALRNRIHASAPPAAVAYPANELRRCWKKLLTGHFHDAITGASFRKVNEELAAGQAEIASDLGRLEIQRREILAGLLDTSAGAQPYVCSNSLSWERRSKVSIPCDQAQALMRIMPSATTPVSAKPATPGTQGRGGQKSADGTGLHILTARGGTPCLGQRTITLDGTEQEVFFVSAPAMGASVQYLEKAGKALPSSPFRYTGETLTTPHYHIRFDACGRIASLADRVSGREYVQAGAALNTFQLAEDATLVCDAWNIDSAHSLKTEPINPEFTPEVISDGHAFFQLRHDFPIGERSHLTQDLIFHADRRRIDFATRIEWQEANRWLKAAFPVNVCTTRVKCEIQYGHIERDTHINREHDRGRFEFCAHKWIALEDGSHGMALLNDCKYGHDVRDAVMRLTLLRAPKSPDAQMDMGSHEFTYSLLPFEGETGVHEIIREAYDLNAPLTLAAATAHAGGSDTYSVFQLDNPNIILEVVKKSEEDDQIVVRLYEAAGGEQATTLTSACDYATVKQTNMLEREAAVLPFAKNRVKLHFRAFEIKTLQLRFA